MVKTGLSSSQCTKVWELLRKPNHPQKILNRFNCCCPQGETRCHDKQPDFQVCNLKQHINLSYFVPGNEQGRILIKKRGSDKILLQYIPKGRDEDDFVKRKAVEILVQSESMERDTMKLIKQLNMRFQDQGYYIAGEYGRIRFLLSDIRVQLEVAQLRAKVDGQQAQIDGLQAHKVQMQAQIDSQQAHGAQMQAQINGQQAHGVQMQASMDSQQVVLNTLLPSFRAQQQKLTTLQRQQSEQKQEQVEQRQIVRGSFFGL